MANSPICNCAHTHRLLIHNTQGHKNVMGTGNSILEHLHTHSLSISYKWIWAILNKPSHAQISTKFRLFLEL